MILTHGFQQYVLDRFLYDFLPSLLFTLIRVIFALFGFSLHYVSRDLAKQSWQPRCLIY